MLKQPLASICRSRLGLGLAAIAAAPVAFAAWAAQPQVPAAAAADRFMPHGVYDTPLRPPQMTGFHGTPPRYPSVAADWNIGGHVILLVDVAADGSVTDVVVESSNPAGVFDQVTLDAVRAWKFTPAIENGKPVARRFRVPVNFAPD